MAQALKAGGPTSSEYRAAVNASGHVRFAQAMAKMDTDKYATISNRRDAPQLKRPVLDPKEPVIERIQTHYNSFVASAEQPADPSNGATLAHKTTNEEGLHIDELQAKGDLQLKTGQSSGAFRTYKQLLNFKLKIYGEKDYRTAQTMTDLARACLQLSRNSDAAELLRRAQRAYDNTEGFDSALLSNKRLLAQALVRSGRLREAENILRAALILSPMDINGDQSLGFATAELADNLREQGRIAEALKYYEGAFTIFGSDIFKPTRIGENGTLGQLELRIADGLYDTGHREVAKPYYFFGMRDIEGIYAETGCSNADKTHALVNVAVRYPNANLASKALFQANCLVSKRPDLPQSYFDLGVLHELVGRSEQATTAFAKSLRLQRDQTGPESPRAARAGERLAALQLGAGQYQAALATARDALAARRITSKREIETTPASDDGAIIRQRTSAAALFVRAALSLKAQNAAPSSLAEETFAAAQSMADTGAGRALSRGAVRTSLDRQGQDLATTWENMLAQRLARDLREPGNAALVEPDAAARAKEDASLATAEAELKSRYPAYFQMVAPDPITLDELQRGLGGKAALLRPNEALIVLTPGKTSLPASQRRGLAFAVTTQGIAWAEIGADPDALNSDITQFRAGLDPAEGRLPTFDRALARRLYETLFSNPSVAALISGKDEWLLSPQGSLLSLPFSALVTGTYGGSEDDADAMRATPWLGIAHALTIIPEVSSLKTIRGLARPVSSSRTAFFGVGDPNFKRGAGENLNGPANPPRPQPEEEIVEPMKFSPEVIKMTAQLFGPAEPALSAKSTPLVRNNNGVGPVTSYTRSGEANMSEIRELPLLPGTRAEILRLADILAAGPDAMLLDDKATEENLREINRRGDLAKARVLAFATHGLIAGDFSGALNQPALVFAPPQGSDTLHGAENDGLLLASEVAQLKLNSDWVILSACNTASGGKPDAEGLAGLARAFFYAGAESLLVSHWRIPDMSAALLTTQAVQVKNGEPEISRAKALQRAMRAVMSQISPEEEGSGFAHPTYWAAFELVEVDR